MNYAEHLNDPVFVNEVALELCRLWSISPIDQKGWALKRIRGFHKHLGKDCQQAISNVHSKFFTSHLYTYDEPK